MELTTLFRCCDERGSVGVSCDVSAGEASLVDRELRLVSEEG